MNIIDQDGYQLATRWRTLGQHLPEISAMDVDAVGDRFGDTSPKRKSNTAYRGGLPEEGEFHQGRVEEELR